MVRKRGYERIEKVVRKKRAYCSPIGEVPTESPSKMDKNILHDRILNLYKEEASAAEESSESILEEEPLSNEKNEEVKNVRPIENSKTLRTQKSAKKKTTGVPIKKSEVKFKDVGGLDKILNKMTDLFLPMTNPEVFAKLGLKPVQGFLLHGPPGCGKTHIVRALAGEFGLPLIEVVATKLVGGISGESESKIRDLFDDAVKNKPCILFIDEIDAITPKRDTTERGSEKRMVTQLLNSFDELGKNSEFSEVMVIGATNRPDSIDPALRRGLRFDSEFAIGIPDEKARFIILKVLTKEIKLAPNFDLEWLAHYTPGYVGADLRGLIVKAVIIRVRRIINKLGEHSENEEIESIPDLLVDFNQCFKKAVAWVRDKMKIPNEEVEKIHIELQDFQEALKDTIPFSKREGFAMVPNVTWDDVGALSSVKRKLDLAIIWPVKYAKLYENSNIQSSKGILLYGPKGCGKTHLAKAVATECSINFLSVKGPELLNMYVGESERAVRQCFQRARNSAPCVIFFDEIDALCPERSSSNINAAAERVVNTLLTEMDGMEERNQVFVIGATNRLEKIDSAMLRPGRLENIIYVGLPSPAERVDILKSLTKNKTKPKISDDVDLEVICMDTRCANFSGADLAHLIRTASSMAMEEHILAIQEPVKVMQEYGTCSLNEDAVEICLKHFEFAFEMVKPSISKKEREYFERLSAQRS